MAIPARPGDREDVEGHPFVGPKVVVCLGATAAQAILGPAFKVTRQRGQFVEWDRDPLVLATVHPSSVLRPPADDSRHAQMQGLVSDLKVAAAALDGRG